MLSECVPRRTRFANECTALSPVESVPTRPPTKPDAKASLAKVAWLCTMTACGLILQDWKLGALVVGECEARALSAEKEKVQAGNKIHF